MAIFWKRFILFALFFEIILFLMLYCFGPNGLHILSGLKEQKSIVLEEVDRLRKEIENLTKNIEISKTTFAKEKIARERLLMKKENETVYFTNLVKAKNV